MPERIYNGPHPKVEVPLPDGTVKNVKHGESADFPNDIAKALDEQDKTWLRKTAQTDINTANGGKE